MAFLQLHVCTQPFHRLLSLPAMHSIQNHFCGKILIVLVMIGSIDNKLPGSVVLRYGEHCLISFFITCFGLRTFCILVFLIPQSFSDDSER